MRSPGAKRAFSGWVLMEKVRWPLVAGLRMVSFPLWVLRLKAWEFIRVFLAGSNRRKGGGFQGQLGSLRHLLCDDTFRIQTHRRRGRRG